MPSRTRCRSSTRWWFARAWSAPAMPSIRSTCRRSPPRPTSICVLTGTLLRAGDRLQVSAQLFETPSGTLVKSHVARVAWGDIFDLQAELVRQVIDVLALPLTSRERRNLLRDAPADPEAYQLYLRANEASSRTEGLAEAIELYEACLRLDPAFAPAMARLGRCYRYQGKYQEGAEADLSRAPIAVAAGARHQPRPRRRARLLRTARGRSRPRRGGAVAAGRPPGGRAPLAGPLRRPRAHLPILRAARCVGGGAPAGAAVQLAGADQRHADLLRAGPVRTVPADLPRGPRLHRRAGAPLARQVRRGAGAHHRTRAVASDAAGHSVVCTGSAPSSRDGATTASASPTRPSARHSLGGEELFYLSRHYAWAGDVRRAVETLARTVEGGYFNYPTLVRDAWFDQLRGEPAFEAVLSRAASRHQAAQAAFQASAGARLLEG